MECVSCNSIPFMYDMENAIRQKLAKVMVIGHMAPHKVGTAIYGVLPLATCVKMENRLEGIRLGLRPFPARAAPTHCIGANLKGDSVLTRQREVMARPSII